LVLKKIPEAELEVMNVIWNSESPISSKKIIKIMEEKKDWKNTTTLTLLSRLSNKNFISCKKEKRITYYTSVITLKSYLGLETRNFFEKVHGNSLKSFITTLHDNNNITEQDLIELEE
jgi:predicted transcriptional regulator